MIIPNYDKKAFRTGCIFLLVLVIILALAVYGLVQLVSNHIIPLFQ